MSCRLIYSVLLLFVCHLSQTQGAPSDEVCTSLLMDTATNQCQPWGNCTGLNCHNSFFNKNVSFVIDKCSDPMVVFVTVYDSASSTILKQMVYNSSDDTTVRDDSDYELTITFGRTISHAHIQVTGLHEGDIATVYIPYTSVPMNASDCMCQSITQMKNNIESPVETKCQTDPECVGLECSLVVQDHNYLIDTEIYPCATPPGLFFFVLDAENSTILSYEYFNSTRNTTLFTFPFYVEVIQLPYSIIIHGVLDTGSDTYNVIPETQIILDKENCASPNSTVSPNTTHSSQSHSTHMTHDASHSHITKPTLIPSNTPTTTGISPETCASLQKLASQSPPNLGECTTNKPCDTINCTTFNDYHTRFTIQPCDHPPAIHAVITDEDNNVVYEGLITNRTEIPLGPFETSLLVLVDDQPGEMIVEVRIKVFPVGEIPFLPRTPIPIDTCQCVQSGSPYPSNCQTHLPSSLRPSSTSPSSTSPSSTSTSPTSTSTSTSRPQNNFFSSAPGIASISVGIVVVVLCLIIISIITILFIVRMVKKRSAGGYSFQRISMGNIQDDDTDIIT